MNVFEDFLIRQEVSILHLMMSTTEGVRIHLIFVAVLLISSHLTLSMKFVGANIFCEEQIPTQSFETCDGLETIISIQSSRNHVVKTIFRWLKINILKSQRSSLEKSAGNCQTK